MQILDRVQNGPFSFRGRRGWYRLGVVLLLGLGVGIAPVRAQSSDLPRAERRAAQEAAQEWLERIDERDVEDAWEDAAPLFRAQTDRAAWTQQAARRADSLGTPSERILATATRRDSVRQAAGPFIVLTYRATFAAGPFEELLLLARHDEEWRVAGYRVMSLRRSAPPVLPAPTAGP